MSARNLRYMQKFAKEYDNKEILQGVLAKISWNHNQIILDKIKDKYQRIWYAKKVLENGWSTELLVHQIELKVTEFKPEYAGKLNFYLSAVDKYLKSENDNPTFGILLCKDKKKITAELALKDINKPRRYFAKYRRY